MDVLPRAPLGRSLSLRGIGAIGVKSNPGLATRRTSERHNCRKEHGLDSLCLGCQIVRGERLPPGGTIIETEHFHAHQDIAVPVPGLVITAARRHVRCLDEFTDEETKELLPLLAAIRRAQRSVLGIEHVYYFYNEDTPAHFHIWMVPRHDWMRQFGHSIESVRPAFLHARANMSNPEGWAEVEHSARLLREQLRR